MNYDHILVNMFFDDNKLNSNYWKFIRRVKKHKYVRISEYLINRYNDIIIENNKILYKEVLYRLLRNIETRILCKVCGSYTKFNHTKELCYNDHCSIKCEMNNKNIRKQQQETSIKKHGTVNNIKKYKETCLEKYGVDNAAKSNKIKEKTIKTNITRYGVKCPLQNKEIKEKVKHSNLVKYNNEIPQKTEQVKNKIKQSNKNTCNIKYGCNNVMQVESIKEKQKNTCLEKYGVSNVLKSKLINDQIHNTNINRYGYIYPMQNNEIYLKSINTKRKNNTFNTSKPEEESFKLLNQKYNNVIRQYKSDLYPFNCDFYIPSLDLYIECNYHWSHGGHPYNENNKDDQLQLNKWIEKNTEFYKRAIITWTIRDVNKRNIAKQNNLNYLEFWSIDNLKNWIK